MRRRPFETRVPICDRIYVIASLSWMAGRVEAAVGYTDDCQTVLASGRGKVPFDLNGLLGTVYLAIGQPERFVEVSRAQLARGRDTHAFARASLTFALTAIGSRDEAFTAATRLTEVAEATRNPSALSLALLAYGYAVREADPTRALAAVRRGLVIAQDSGNRGYETHLAATLARLEAEHGDPLAALEYCTVAIRNYHDSGNTAQVHPTLAALAAILERLGRYESAATIAGFARKGPFSTTTIPELGIAIAHLGEVLGDQTYESLARKGETMTISAMVAYAYDQIDQARAELEAVSK
jgi:tetratricopeptide (TPR) repeat protein